jgi:purine-binding chemotaxis protein CheW
MDLASAQSDPGSEASPMDRRANEKVELLSFRCGGRAYAIDIMAVREIRTWSEPTPLPHCPAYMLGMLNLRGSVLPVIDLSLRLGQAASVEDRRNVIIIVQFGTSIQGLLVEAVSDIISPDLTDMQEVPRLPNGEQNMADGLFVLGEDVVQRLSLERVVFRADCPDGRSIP